MQPLGRPPRLFWQCAAAWIAVLLGVVAVSPAAGESSEQGSGSLLLQRRSRARRPFLVDWKVRIMNAGLAEPGLAAKLALDINTPGSPMQTLLPGSLAKPPGGFFPPPLVPATPPHPIGQVTGMLPEKEYFPADTSMTLAKQALALAHGNEAEMRGLADRFYLAAQAHADGLTYSDKTMGGAAVEQPASFGDLVKEALVTTPPPTLPPGVQPLPPGF